MLIKRNLCQNVLLILLTASLLLSSCVENSGLRGKTVKASSNVTDTETAAPGTPIDTTSALQSVKVELSHLVDPFDGTYKKKLSIPKNFKGNLYLAGLNVAALSDKLIKVRFKYGVDRQPITLDATLARAPGIVPQTDIQVLAINMNSRPFSKVRLGYDLYDYNDYSDASKAPVSDPRDSGVYCRGLQLEDDPTFDSATSLGATCSTGTDKCLYAYAKVTDATLYNATSQVTSIPSRSQVWSMASGVRNPTITSSAPIMCLPDHEDLAGFNNLFSLTLPGLSYNTAVLGMIYRGPYRAINPTGLKIQGAAIFNSTKGLFEIPNSPLDPYTGFRSLLFPRAGKISLNQDVHYFGSNDRFGARTTLVGDSTGVSRYVDGCNIRVTEYDPATTEGIGSCNVNASIEIFYMKGDAEVSIAIDKSIKLQLLRPSIISEGKEVLVSAFKRCENSSSCGTSECCFNSRCWSTDIVSQCLDQTPVIGNQENGANCSSDYECASLCCDQSRGSCAPHDPNGIVPIACSKSSGQRCVTREFCKPQFVQVCKIVKSSTVREDGTLGCNLKCSPVETYGDCKSGFCEAPVTPTPPPFDPNDCSQAVDP